VYDHGEKFSGPLFAAFCLRAPEDSRASARVGFTVPKALGVAVVRNRIRRRVREAVRKQFDRLDPRWEIVINPRKGALTAPFAQLEREVGRLFERCGR
jgi:ribonuclease P protein component